MTTKLSVDIWSDIVCPWCYVGKRRLEVHLSAAELARRLKKWKAPAPRYKTGVMARYAKLVSSASEGAVLV